MIRVSRMLSQLILEQEQVGNKINLYNFFLRYGIAPKVADGQKPRIEVFNPVDDHDDQKTYTAILFDNNGNFIDFGSKALQKYAEIVYDEETAMLFQTVYIKLFISI